VLLLSYDFELEKKKGQPFDYNDFRRDINRYELLSRQEMVFENEFPELSASSSMSIAEIKHDRETNQAYRNFLKGKGIKVSLLDRLLKRVDSKLAEEFWKTREDQYISVLSVFAKGSDAEKLLIYQQLRELAIKHHLILFNPQHGKYLNLQEDPLKLVL
jgi:hypothetical protein